MKCITLEDLVFWEACEEQCKRFELTFPDGADVTAGNVEKALAAGIQLPWIASRLPGNIGAAFVRSVREPAYALNCMERDAAWRLYCNSRRAAEHTLTQSLAGYSGTSPEYFKAASVAEERYREACAAAFDKYLQDCEVAEDRYRRTGSAELLKLLQEA